MTTDEKYMYRCIELAKQGAGYVAPNPLVGAVLVHDDEIIGEGFHQHYGEAHAEVNCINGVAEGKKYLIASSVLYVSLEPCAHYGKTPPCSDLIIKNNIPKVVIGCRDPFVEVDGKGIEKLRNAGVEVVLGVLEKECRELNKRFLTFHTQHRPYTILKWAQTANKKISALSEQRLLITNDLTNKLVHKWRSENMGILVGTNTALLDNPQLNNRFWNGKNPVRLIIDMHLRLPAILHIYDEQIPTIIFNTMRHDMDNFSFEPTESMGVNYYQVTEDVNLVHQVMNACYQNNIQSILVEGGAKLLQSFIDENMWDEAFVITNESLMIEHGLNSPEFNHFHFLKREKIFTDRIDNFSNMDNSFYQ